MRSSARSPAKGDWKNLYATYERALQGRDRRLRARPRCTPRWRACSSENLGEGERSVDDVEAGARAARRGPRGAACTVVSCTRSRATTATWSTSSSARRRSPTTTRTAFASSWISVAVWYERLDRARSALESYERVLDIDPSYTPALFAIANIHRRASATQELVDTLHRIIDVGSAHARSRQRSRPCTWSSASSTRRELKNPMRAVDAYTHAIDVNPQQLRGHGRHRAHPHRAGRTGKRASASRSGACSGSSEPADRIARPARHRPELGDDGCAARSAASAP